MIASDEAYTELWFDEPPVSALQVADRSRVIVFQTLSKRSSMTGYRSGFVAAPPEVIAALKSYRPTVGTAPQEFVQRASVVAWNDERHVEETRARYAAKRDVLLPVLAAQGLGGRRERGDDVPLGRGPATTARPSRRGCSSAACSSRPARSSGRAARATSASRSSRRSTSASARRRSLAEAL